MGRRRRVSSSLEAKPFRRGDRPRQRRGRGAPSDKAAALRLPAQGRSVPSESEPFAYSMLMKMPARMTEVIVTVMNPPTSILGSIWPIRKSYSSLFSARAFEASSVRM